MKTYLQTSTSDPPLQGNGALAKHTLVCHHQGMFGCRENDRKLKKKKKMKKKKKSGKLTVLVFPLSQNFKVPKSPNSTKHGSLYRVFLRVKYHYALQKH